MPVSLLLIFQSTLGGGGGEKFLLLWVGRHKTFAFSLEGGGVKNVFNPYFPHLPTPLPINNDHSLNLFIYDTYDNTIKTCFIVLKQVELSAGLKWAVMTLICPCWGFRSSICHKNPRIRRSARLEIRTRSSRVGQKQQNFENRTDINSTKILKQLLSLLNNILAL